MKRFFFYPLVISFLMSSCNQAGNENTASDAQEELVAPVGYVVDPHSFAKPGEAVTSHLKLDLSVDFEQRVIQGVARYDIKKEANATEIIFDIDSITIDRITLDAEEKGAMYRIEPGNEFGQKLTVNIGRNTRKVNIYYHTSPNATALQWLSPEQTLGKLYPFLFTQGQAILTRSWIPCQDSPGVRITYDAAVTVPDGMMALMSAGGNPTELNEDGRYEFTMAQPVPPYLIALAAGQLRFRPLSDNTGVYAEPGLIDAAAFEFSDTPNMLKATEDLYGSYRWDQYDVLVLPPSFPFGGMENPRLTFATPTIIAGDRSLTSLVAHELAHSWSGNLVTNATWNDFWLNEGFTVYIEKRIMEALYGKDYTEMLNLLDYQSLLETVETMGENNPLTRLKLDLEGKDPDEGMTDIAYEKGYQFLRLLEEYVGREKFDNFLKGYFDEFAFQAVTTEVFIEYLNANLLVEGAQDAPDVQNWIFGTGIPADIVIPQSDRLDKIKLQMLSWYENKVTTDQLNTREWTTHEWLHFIRNLPQGIQPERLAQLDEAFHLTTTGNAEIKAAWFEVGIRQSYPAINDELENFLSTVGRRKFLMPLYTAMAETVKGKEEALKIYASARANYHAVSVRSIDELLGFDPEKYKGSISL